MKPFNPEQSEEWVEARLEAFLDGTLPPEEAALMAHLLDEEEGLGEAFLLAERVKTALNDLPSYHYPTHLTDQVLAQARRRPGAYGLRSFWQQFQALDRGMLRPALALATFVAVVFLGGLFGRQPAQTSAQAEVDQATLEVKWALAYLSEVGRQTGTSVRKVALEPHVMIPAQKTVGTIMQHKNQ